MAELAASHEVSPEVKAWFESRVTYKDWLGAKSGTFVKANIPVSLSLIHI